MKIYFTEKEKEKLTEDIVENILFFKGSLGSNKELIIPYEDMEIIYPDKVRISGSTYAFKDSDLFNTVVKDKLRAQLFSSKYKEPMENIIEAVAFTIEDNVKKAVEEIRNVNTITMNNLKDKVIHMESELSLMIKTINDIDAKGLEDQTLSLKETAKRLEKVLNNVLG